MVYIIEVLIFVFSCEITIVFYDVQVTGSPYKPLATVVCYFAFIQKYWKQKQRNT